MKRNRCVASLNLQGWDASTNTYIILRSNTNFRCDRLGSKKNSEELPLHSPRWHPNGYRMNCWYTKGHVPPIAEVDHLYWGGGDHNICNDRHYSHYPYQPQCCKNFDSNGSCLVGNGSCLGSCCGSRLGSRHGSLYGYLLGSCCGSRLGSYRRGFCCLLRHEDSIVLN